jgi:23S rRNA pseudouridine1911/1915/1917 synthase
MDKVYKFTADKPGVRLDKYICDRLSELSRARVQRLIGEGHVTVNDQLAKAGLRLNAGDRLKVTLPPAPPSPLTPEAMPLNIIYEDEDLLVVDKPAGLTVHPAPGHPAHTLVNAILARFPHLAALSDSLRPGIVHRLDRDTSGVMAVAKSRLAQSKLTEQFRAHSVAKAYLVLVKGHLTPENGVIEAPVGRDPRNRKKMAVVAGGREARTEYNVIKYIGDYTLLEVKPETGRTHQIRVHFAAIGFPVVGDKIYGVKSPFVPRQFIHATRLGFKLPSSGRYVEFKSELPADLAQALEDIG